MLKLLLDPGFPASDQESRLAVSHN